MTSIYMCRGYSSKRQLSKRAVCIPQGVFTYYTTHIQPILYICPTICNGTRYSVVATLYIYSINARIRYCGDISTYGVVHSTWGRSSEKRRRRRRRRWRLLGSTAHLAHSDGKTSGARNLGRIIDVVVIYDRERRRLYSACRYIQSTGPAGKAIQLLLMVAI